MNSFKEEKKEVMEEKQKNPQTSLPSNQHAVSESDTCSLDTLPQNKFCFHLFFQPSLIFSGIFFLFIPTENELAESLTRSKTMPTLGRPKLNRKLSTFNDGDRLRVAKEMVEKAIKVSLSGLDN